MAKLTKEEIKKIADLARLDISSEEVGYYSEELSDVLNYVEQLNEIDTDDIEPMAQATDLFTVVREDAQEDVEGVRERITKAVMNAVPFTQNGFAKVRSIFKDKE